MSDDPVGQVPASVDAESRRGLEALADEVLPALVTRLRASRLGELEVRSGDWRIRLRRDPSSSSSRAAGVGSEGPGNADQDALMGSVARSPAVGYFKPGTDLVVGASVQAGDLLGGIDVLGIFQDVNAPADGMVSRVLAEDGQAVEYGQALADIDPLEVDPADVTVGP